MDARAFQRLSAAQAQAWLNAHPDALILDARAAQHHAAAHLSGSVRLDGRNHEMLLLREPRSRPVFVYCYHGNASQTYAQMFVDFGFQQVCDLMGGFEAWERRQSHEAQALWLAEWLQRQGFEGLNTPGSHGNTPLMHAAWKGETAVVEALLGCGVELHAVNGDGNTALWLACVANDPDLVAALVAAGLDINHANATGATCLMYAASSGKPAIVQRLLELGADPALQSQDGFTALDMAASLECLRLLRAATPRAGSPRPASASLSPTNA
ncbi:ankyrin repeat domain-containing protein [Azohydromonas lata]|uniref:ankyrin repeat domain-containing protein n=1 Tax=Azohydromonas lata TaxID=45677 RepID=UPI000A072E85|nr:ankyrin repeat domain-containing protein [Azohydromonas lata]